MERTSLLAYSDKIRSELIPDFDKIPFDKNLINLGQPMNPLIIMPNLIKNTPKNNFLQHFR